MKSAIRRFVVAFVVALSLGAAVEATFSEVVVHGTTWGTADKWKIWVYNGPVVNGLPTGSQIGYGLFTYNQMQVYLQADGKYHVQFSALGVADPSAAQSSYSQHINLTVGRSESMIEILDKRDQLARERAQTFGAKPWQVLRGVFVGIFDGRVVGGGGSGTAGKAAR